MLVPALVKVPRGPNRTQARAAPMRSATSWGRSHWEVVSSMVPLSSSFGGTVQFVWCQCPVHLATVSNCLAVCTLRPPRQFPARRAARIEVAWLRP